MVFLLWLIAIGSTPISTHSLAQPVSSVRQFYAAFNDHVEARVRATYDKPTIDADVPIVKSRDLRQIDLQDSWCLVQLEPEEATILQRMWDTLQAISFHDTGVHHEELSRSSENSAAGYDYVHYPLIMDKEQAIIGTEEQQQHVQDAFQLLATLGKDFSAAALDRTLVVEESTNRNASTIMDQLVGATLEGTFQRLAQYRKSSDESIRPHCDWSFVTVVPVSTMAALEVFHQGAWIRPENVAPHYEYVVVMAGKWLELLTAVPCSTIHRVVACPEGRFSAPLFLRPQPQVSDDAEHLVLEDCQNVTLSQARLRQFLIQFSDGAQ